MRLSLSQPGGAARIRDVWEMGGQGTWAVSPSLLQDTARTALQEGLQPWQKRASELSHQLYCRILEIKTYSCNQQALFWCTALRGPARSEDSLQCGHAPEVPHPESARSSSGTGRTNRWSQQPGWWLVPLEVGLVGVLQEVGTFQSWTYPVTLVCLCCENSSSFTPQIYLLSSMCADLPFKAYCFEACECCIRQTRWS